MQPWMFEAEVFSRRLWQALDWKVDLSFYFHEEKPDSWKLPWRYYVKRPSHTDHRLDTLPDALFTDKTVLDVGCNEGFVTCEIGQSKGAKKVVGVDIDESLIRAAWRRRRVAWSLQAPQHAPSMPVISTNGLETSKAKKRKRDELETGPPIPDYFPAALEHTHGPLPIPPSQTRSLDAFPHNVTFRCADWVNDLILEDKDGYDVVIGFSISKWIHLNGGDEGIRRFFSRIYNVLKPGGKFVLEPQPWESYVKARRMDKKLQENYAILALRPSDFESILVNLGFSSVHHFGSQGEGGFCRQIDLYTKS